MYGAVDPSQEGHPFRTRPDAAHPPRPHAAACDVPGRRDRHPLVADKHVNAVLGEIDNLARHRQPPIPISAFNELNIERGGVPNGSSICSPFNRVNSCSASLCS